jgi:hypothetical protein
MKNVASGSSLIPNKPLSISNAVGRKSHPAMRQEGQAKWVSLTIVQGAES